MRNLIKTASMVAVAAVLAAGAVLTLNAVQFDTANAVLTTAERAKLRVGLGDATTANTVADRLDGTFPNDDISGGSHLCTDNAGTAGTGVTAKEFCNGRMFVTELTLTNIAYTIGDNASLADGALIYTFPAGEMVLQACSQQVALTLTTGTPTTDTPEICLGTVIGTGAVATCGTTATFEDVLGPDVAADMAGTNNILTQIGPTADTAGFVIATAAAHTLHLNIADAWANVDNTAATASGTVICMWTKM